MAEDGTIKYKNLVYLMIRKYGDGWRKSFPKDMGIPLEKCDRIYELYHEEVEKEIEAENQKSEVPTADELIDKGLLKLRTIISTCDDPSKLTRSIEILAEMRDSGSVKKEVKKSIFDRIQEKAKNENK